MVLPYMVTWIPSIYPIHVSIYTSTMDPMGVDNFLKITIFETTNHEKHDEYNIGQQEPFK